MLKLDAWQGLFSSVRLDRHFYSAWCAQLPDSKITFSPNSSNQNDFLWAKYELIWSDITAQTVTLGANLLGMAQTIPQNAQRMVFFKTKSCVYLRYINFKYC